MFSDEKRLIGNMPVIECDYEYYKNLIFTNTIDDSTLYLVNTAQNVSISRGSDYTNASTYVVTDIYYGKRKNSDIVLMDDRIIASNSAKRNLPPGKLVIGCIFDENSNIKSYRNIYYITPDQSVIPLSQAYITNMSYNDENGGTLYLQISESSANGPSGPIAIPTYGNVENNIINIIKEVMSGNRDDIKIDEKALPEGYDRLHIDYWSDSTDEES